MICPICEKVIDKIYSLPVKINNSFFHRECYNLKKAKRSKEILIPWKKLTIIFVLFVGLFLYSFFRQFLFLFILFIMGSTWVLLGDLPGVELTTLAVALTGLNYGPVMGMIIGILSTIPHFYVKRSWFTIFSMIGFALIGLIAGYNILDFLWLGLIGTLAYHLIVDGAFIATYGGDFWWTFLYTFIHLCFNFLIFLSYIMYL